MFAEGYQADGRLVPRGQPVALIDSDEQAVAQTLETVLHGRVTVQNGAVVPVNAQTVCLHVDGTHALLFARLLREHFGAQHIAVTAG